MTQEKILIPSEILFPMIEEQLNNSRKASFTVTGMSMWPFLCHSRDQVTVELVTNESIKRGDIILFKTLGEKYVLHRVTSLSSDWFETTGDSNIFRDGKYPYSTVVARVCSVNRKGKDISCSSLSWKILSRIWMSLFPVRKPLCKVWFSIRKHLKRALKKLKKH